MENLRRTLFRLLSVLLSLGATCLALEIVLRHTPQETLGYQFFGRRFERPQEFQRDFTKNSLKFHDKEPLADPGDRIRIFLVGDSFVDSSTTPIPQSLGPQLEQHLNAELPDSSEVIAIGRSGWGQFAQLRRLKRELPRFRPQIVITLFLGLNDVSDDSQRLRQQLYKNDRRIFRKRPGWTGLRFDDAPLLFFEGSELNRFISFRIANLRLSGRSIDGHEQLGFPFDYLVYATEYDADWVEAWKRKEELLADTAAAVREHGGEYLMVSASTPHGVLGQERGVRWLEWSYPAMKQRSWDLDKPDRLLAEACHRLDIPLLRLEPTFRDATAAGAQLHWQHDGHWNAAGNALAGRLMASFLLTESNALARRASRKTIGGAASSADEAMLESPEALGFIE
jgi:hypothetical protein